MLLPYILSECGTGNDAYGLQPTTPIRFEVEPDRYLYYVPHNVLKLHELEDGEAQIRWMKML